MPNRGSNPPENATQPAVSEDDAASADSASPNEAVSTHWLAGIWQRTNAAHRTAGCSRCRHSRLVSRAPRATPDQRFGAVHPDGLTGDCGHSSLEILRERARARDIECGGQRNSGGIGASERLCTAAALGRRPAVYRHERETRIRSISADGLSEELINALALIDELQVAARTSSFSFKGQALDVETIGHKLHVGAVLEGSVRRSGNTVRVTAQLINASNGFHIWSHTYDRDLKDVLAVQSDIAISRGAATTGQAAGQ